MHPQDTSAGNLGGLPAGVEDAMTPYDVSPWVAIAMIALAIGWQFIGFPARLRERLRHRRH